MVDGKADCFGHLPGEGNFGDGSMGEIAVKFEKCGYEGGLGFGRGGRDRHEGVCGPLEIAVAESAEHIEEAASKFRWNGFDIGVIEEPEGL